MNWPVYVNYSLLITLGDRIREEHVSTTTITDL